MRNSSSRSRCRTRRGSRRSRPRPLFHTNQTAQGRRTTPRGLEAPTPLPIPPVWSKSQRMRAGKCCIKCMRCINIIDDNRRSQALAVGAPGCNYLSPYIARRTHTPGGPGSVSEFEVVRDRIYRTAPQPTSSPLTPRARLSRRYEFRIVNAIARPPPRPAPHEICVYPPGISPQPMAPDHPITNSRAARVVSSFALRFSSSRGGAYARAHIHMRTLKRRATRADRLCARTRSRGLDPPPAFPATGAYANLPPAPLGFFAHAWWLPSSLVLAASRP